MLNQALKAVSVEWSRAAALEVLEDVAEGRPKEVIVAAALGSGLEAFARPDISFEYPCVRVYAMDRIGASGLPEAIEYLRTMSAKVGPDSTETIYPASQVALQKALLLQEEDPQRQITFIEQQLTKPSVGQVASRAMDELCNRGSTGSLPEIKKLVKYRNHDLPYGDKQIQWCEARMEIVNRDPDRAKALGSALSVEEALRDPQFEKTWWLVEQLRDMNSDEANSVIDRFLAQIGQRLPKNFAAPTTEENQALRGLVQGIGLMRPPRPPAK